jgi:regulator of sigma E protease
MTIIYAILIFCLLITVHELGHFVVAKACGVKVNEFAIGMGPAFFQKQKGETLYSLRVFPIGGFCAMEGEDEDSKDERAFNNKPAWQRALVLAAGSFMNLVTAVALMIIIAFSMGQPTTTIDQVMDNSPAYEMGIQSGDTIKSIDGEEIDDWTELTTIISAEVEENPMTFVVIRDGKELALQVAPEYDAADKRGKIGITPTYERNIMASFGTGIKNTGEMAVMMVDIIKQLFTGDVSATELSGPVGIVYAVNESAKSGVIYVVYLAALLSLNLAIMNMLPFPALDGGRLIFLVIRKITGKKVTDEIEGKIHFIGILLLFALMIYVTWNDIMKFIIPIFS